ncbi:hypothetical protein GCM10023165_31650 [Variovorax defluvii]|uniref:Filamentous haemagglutinin FhaB/tRNA nuclease CdiA-like TPS domain-containing protein n=1 Tax=Variovorax defluvii TaxID=913761 RepID=A0ABP8HXG1_9BURK
MNKHLHRIVFNATRGLRMVVHETARSAGKTRGAAPGVLVTALLASPPAPAQIVGAPGVAPNLRPMVLVAPNGVPLVDIQTPSAAGVSRNLYQQFDVQSRGVVLNNSRTDVQTRLGGWVHGNPYLATGPARIILNEIVSGDPTRLRGAIEVGGQRAEVIVANPAGIAVDGGTFINASRATLTTGTPQLNAFGGLDGYVDHLKEGLKSAILDTLAAQSAFVVGTRLEPGSASNALAHALVGCAIGAARTNDGCSAGAIGAAIGELAASLYDPDATNTHGDTVKFAAMMGGIGAALAGLDAAHINLASEAGANAAANNWLATQQRARMARELNEAKTALDQLKVMGRWTLVSAKQDALTASGVGKGLVDAGISDIQGLADFLANPVQGLNGLKQIITSPEARQQLGDATFRELDAKIDRMKTALEAGGDQNAEQLGKDLGGLIWQVGTVVTGAGAAAKGGVALTNAAVSLGTRTLENAALQFMKLDAGVIRGFKSAEEVNAMMKAADGWSPAWMPGTSVAEVTMKPGTIVRMVVDERSFYSLMDLSGRADIGKSFGGWATFDDVPNAAYARNQLAITSDLTEKSGSLYVVDVQLTKPVNAQVGQVGAQGTAVGGGNQLHFFVGRDHRASVFKVIGGRALP